MQKMKLEIVKNKGRNSGKEYLALVVDLGYRNAILTFNSTIIAEISGMSFGDLHSISLGKPVLLGEIVRVLK